MNEQTDDKTAKLQEQLKMLETLFLQRLPERLREIQAALDQCVADPRNTEAVVLLHRLLHSIAGTAGTFGLTALGEQARSIEKALAPLKHGGETDGQLVASVLPGLRDFLAMGASLAD